MVPFPAGCRRCGWETTLPDTTLGDWYANLVRAGRTQVVLAVSERTLLPVVLPARDGRSLVRRLAEALDPLLVSLDVLADDIATERAAMQDWTIGKTANRRIVGLQHDPDRTPLEHSLWLARTPMKVIEYGAPDRATVAAFAARRVLRVVGCR